MIRCLTIFVAVIIFSAMRVHCQSWNELIDSANHYSKIKNYTTSLQWAMLALSRAENEFGELDSNYLSSLGIVSDIFLSTSQLDSAIKYGALRLDLSRKLYKSDNTNLAMSINNMAECLKSAGNYSQAEPLYNEALDILKRLYKSDNSDLASCMCNLALLYNYLGRFTEAEKLYTESLSMFRRLYRGDNSDLATSINNTALFFNDRGRISEAESLFKESLEMRRRLYKSNDPRLAVSLNNMGYFLVTAQRFLEAEPYFLESIELLRMLFKNGHPALAYSLSNLGFVYEHTGKFEEAEKYYREALEMRRRFYTNDHQELFQSINNLATLLTRAGRLADAGLLFHESVKICRNCYNSNNPDLARCLINMAQYLFECGNMPDAENYFIEGLGYLKKAIINYFSFLSEKEKSQFWNTLKVYFEGFNSFAIKRSIDNPNILTVMLDYQLILKGILLNSTIRTKNRIINSGDTNLIKKYETWLSLKSKIAKFRSIPQQMLASKGIQLDSMIFQSNIQEKELSALSLEFANEYNKQFYTMKDIANSLRKDQAAIEILRFKLIEKGWKDSIIYAALIIKRDSRIPEIALMQNGKELENKYRQLYFIQIEKQRKKVFDPETITLSLKELYSNYFSAISGHLHGIKTVYLSPDGIYNLINLNTLINPATGKYLLDELDLRLVTSTRNLVVKKNLVFNNVPKVDIAELFGDPQFVIDSMNYLSSSSHYHSMISGVYYSPSSSIDSISRGDISPLPGTRKEIYNIEKSLLKQKWEVIKHLGQDALEYAVKAVDNPRVLHIATHGKFLKDIEKSGDERMLNIENQWIDEYPLLRSMLLLAGSGNALSIKGLQPTIQIEDGLLTAYEAQNLSLDRTELVVLSACETGLGEVKNGEGVYGLQRAFQVAGAKSLIMSLWSVSDQSTQELMTVFYDKWLSGRTKREAFREAQIELKKKYPGFYYWGAFVMVGE